MPACIPLASSMLSNVLLEKWSSSSGDVRGEAEQTIRALFVDTSVKAIFIPVFGMEEEKKRELRRNVRKWNRGDTRPKCDSTQISL